MEQLLQIAGALLVLTAFVALQLGVTRVESIVYVSFNVIGSLALAILAWHDAQWGFLLLEATWAGFSLAALAKWIAGATRPA